MEENSFIRCSTVALCYFFPSVDIFLPYFSINNTLNLLIEVIFSYIIVSTGMILIASTGMRLIASTGMRLIASTGMRLIASTGMRLIASTGMRLIANI